MKLTLPPTTVPTRSPAVAAYCGAPPRSGAVLALLAEESVAVCRPAGARLPRRPSSRSGPLLAAGPDTLRVGTGQRVRLPSWAG